MHSENVSSADNQQERLKLIGWIVGFVDGEGAFTISILKNPTSKTGWQVFPEFVVTQGAKSKEVLYELKDFFSCGNVYLNRRFDNHKEDIHRYCVRSLGDLYSIIIPFFVESKLRTAKSRNFSLFVDVLNLIQKDKHLNLEGIEEIALIAKQMNRKVTPKFLESSHTIRRTASTKKSD